MEVLVGAWVAALVYVAFAFDVFGFLARDELMLRLLMLIASGFYLLYYFLVADTPLWDAIYTNGALAAVNLAMIVVVVLERTTFAMTAETAALFRMFPLLSPGQFRRLIRACDEIEAPGTEVLVRQGERPDSLYFIIDGSVDVTKDGRATTIGGGVFIGEIAFLTHVPATATVSVAPGTRYLRWRVDDLGRAMRRSPSLKTALLGHLNLDLARKVAQSHPSAPA